MKWLGKCPICQNWDTFVKEDILNNKPLKAHKGRSFSQEKDNVPLLINEISFKNEERYQTGVAEVDRVLGGGIVHGACMLIGGDPGIGKSTLLLQIMHSLALNKYKVMYVTAEESLKQTKLRANRLGIIDDPIYIMSETRLDKIKSQAKSLMPDILVIDSIQTIFSPTVDSMPGSISQVKECASEIMFFAKAEGISTFIVGHVTKEGMVAGPRMLEHLVDTVLYFEGNQHNQYRVLRSVKNRFGSTNEIGVFEMKAKGLEQVTNPSEYFLSERKKDSAGSCVLVTLEGTRPLLVEFQALVSPAVYGNPRRNALGIDINRLNMLIAVMEKKLGYTLSGQDIFANVVGGIKIQDPSADLGIIAAIASSYLNKPICSKTVLLGEVGLVGEVRTASQIEQRIVEVNKMGFTRILLPLKNKNSTDSTNSNMKASYVHEVQTALEGIFN